MSENRVRLLLVDDDERFRRIMAPALREMHGFDVDEAANGREAMARLAAVGGAFDVILIDQNLKSAPDGIALLGEIRQAFPDVECIVLTGYAPEDRERALAAGAFRYVEKQGVKEKELVLLIRGAAQQARIRALSRDILSRLEWSEVLQRILSAAASLFEADEAALTLYDERAGLWQTHCLNAYPDDAACAALGNVGLAEAVSQGGHPLWRARLDAPDDGPLAALGMKSLTAAPVAGQAGVLGALIAYSHQPDHFDGDRRAGLQTLAMWAGLALDNARAYRLQSDQTADLATLQHLSTDIASSLETNTVGEKTCAAAARFFDADHSGLLRFEPEDEYGVVTAEFPPHSGALNMRVPLRDVPAEQLLISNRQPLAIPDVAACQDLGPVRDILLGLGIRATLIVPVVAVDRLFGSFSIDFATERAFDEDDIKYALMFAANTAVALDHARVHDESRRRGDLLDKLVMAAHNMKGLEEPKQLMPRLVRLAVELMGCSAGCLFINHEDRRELELRVTFGLPDEPAQRVMGYHRSLAGRAARTGEIESCSDYQGSDFVEPLLGAYSFRAGVAMPLLIMGEVRAVVLLLDTAPRVCAEADHAILARYADQAAIALRISEVMTTSQHSISQVQLLHKISDHLQSDNDLEDIFHMVLTGVTADFGLELNVAALFQLTGGQLIGRVGIGHFDEVKARADWERDQHQARNEFGRYYRRLKEKEFRRDPMPVDRAIRGLSLPRAAGGLFDEVMKRGEVIVVTAEDEARLPRAFVDAYQPSYPLIVAPLMSRKRAIGVIVGDNRFTHAPITDELRGKLRGFADAAAVAIDKVSLRTALKRQLKKSRREKRKAESQAELNARLAARLERVWGQATAVTAAVVQEELEPTLKAIADSLATVVGADVTTVYAYDAATQRFTHSGYHIEHQRVPDSVCLPQNILPGSLLYHIVELPQAPYRLLHDEIRPNHSLMRGEFVRMEGIQAAVALQLRSQGECVGVLLVDYRTPHTFDEHELDSIQSFAHQAAAAIYGQKQYRAATYGNRQLEALHHAALSIGDARGLDETLTEIARQALTVVGATGSHAACHVALLHGNTLQFRAASSEETRQRLRDEVGVIRLDRPRRPSIIARVALKGCSESLPDAPADPDYWPFDPRTRSQLAVVIKRRETVIGVINLEHPEPAHFTAEDQAAMERLAALAAVSIQAAEDREQRAIVARISREVNTSRNLDDFLQAVYKELAVIFQRHEIAIRVALGHYEPEAARLVMRRIPWPPGEGRRFISLSDDGIVPRVAAERRPRHVADVTQITDPREYYALWPDTVSEFAVPVEYEGTLLAVLDVQSTAPDAFTAEDQNLVIVLADQLATTMHNLRQNAELENTQRTLRKRAMLINYSLITTRWSHDIRQVARNIIDSLDVMDLDLAEAGIEEASYRAHKNKIASLANQIRVKQPIKTRTDRRQGIRRLAANDLLRRVIADLRADWRDSAIRRHIHVVETYAAPDSDHVAVDEGEFRWIIETILDNAGRYLRGQGNAQIDISTCRANDAIELSFADNGPGIDDDRLPLLFEEPTKKRPGELGEGIGLYITSALIEEYGGRIAASNLRPRGALFTLTFPLANGTGASAGMMEGS